jgi:hypothetical protein
VPGAGCPRVTHPFAGFPSAGLPPLRFSLDLHVLSTPPAFVLSQDQTLRRDSEPARRRESSSVLERPARANTHSGPTDPAGCPAGFRTYRQEVGREPHPMTGVALAFGTLFSSQGARPLEPPKTRKGRRTCRRPPALGHCPGRSLGSLPLFGCQEEVRHAGTLLPRPIGGLHPE